MRIVGMMKVADMTTAGAAIRIPDVRINKYFS
jgi:hypothetical protein